MAAKIPVKKLTTKMLGIWIFICCLTLATGVYAGFLLSEVIRNRGPQLLVPIRLEEKTAPVITTAQPVKKEITPLDSAQKEIKTEQGTFVLRRTIPISFSDMTVGVHGALRELTKDVKGTTIFGFTPSYVAKTEFGEWFTPEMLYVKSQDNKTLQYDVLLQFAVDGFPRVMWKDTTINTIPYHTNAYFKCNEQVMALLPKDKIPAKDLVIIGTVIDTKEELFGFKDAQHPMLAVWYKEWAYAQAEPEEVSYDQFIASRPLFFYKHPLGFLVRFSRHSFIPVKCNE